MMSLRRKALSRKNPPNTIKGNGYARSFANHTDANKPIPFHHGQDGFPSIIVLDISGAEQEYAMIQDELPRQDWAKYGEADTDIFVRFIPGYAIVWTTLESGVIAID